MARSTISMARSTPAQNERGAASSTRRGPVARAQRSSVGRMPRGGAGARGPPVTMLAVVVSAIARTTLNGTEPRASANQADSMSTASAPVAPSAARCSPRTNVGEETIGPVRTRQPAASRSAATSAAAAMVRTVSSSVLRSSVATTMSPGRNEGSRPPETPATATAMSPSKPRCRPGARSALSRPIPESATAPPTAYPSMRNAASTRSSAMGHPPHVAAEGAHREHHPVEVVVDVEVAGEPGPRVPGLVPGAVGTLGVDQVADAARRGRAPLPRGQEGQQGPGGLRRGRGPAAALGRIVVGAQVLAPPAVVVLVRLEPGHGAAHGAVLGREAGDHQGRHGRAGPVDVVGAPAAEPRTVGLLGAEEPLD